MANIYKSKFTGQEIDDILTNVSNVTNIEANPSGEATEELTKLTIGDITYNLGGGTPVEANPSGDGTVELTKIKIGDTVYSIPQQSGGNDGEKLYYHEYNVYTSETSNITLYLICNRSSGFPTFEDVPLTLVNHIWFIGQIDSTHGSKIPWSWKFENRTFKLYFYYTKTNSTDLVNITVFSPGSYTVRDMSGNVVDEGSYGGN